MPRRYGRRGGALGLAGGVGGALRLAGGRRTPAQRRARLQKVGSFLGRAHNFIKSNKLISRIGLRYGASSLPYSGVVAKGPPA